MISPEWDRLKIVWPWSRYRLHLEAEVEYLKQQLAQKQRRCDELQDVLVELKKPSMKIQYVQKPDGKMIPVQPRGWDAYRAWRKEHPDIEDVQPQGGDNAIQS